MNKSRKSDLLVWILLAGGILTLSMFAPQLPYLILKAYFKDNELKKKRLQNDIRYLQKQGLIEKSYHNENYFLKLTNKGQLEAEFLKAITEPINPQKRWGKFWYLAIFDIPDKKTSARHRISLILKSIGCIQVQKSVYLSPYPFRDKLLVIVRQLRIESCFYYFEIQDQSVFDHFKDSFHL